MSRYYSNDLANLVLNSKQGIKIKDLYESAKQLGFKGNLRSFYTYVKRITNGKFKKENPANKFLESLKKYKTISIIDLSNKLECTPKRILDYVEYYRSMGYEISINENYVIFSKDAVSTGQSFDNPLEDREIIFAVVSDPHFGSKACQITALNTFCDIARKKGIKHIFMPGDITAGYGVYSGQTFDLYAVTSGEQEASVILNLPHGFKWYAIGGNHDNSFIKSNGHNVLLSIQHAREDFHYVGFDQADVPILPGVEVKMWHPSGGVPYAVSYRLQKGIEQIMTDELTQISRGVKDYPSVRYVLAGHLHIQMEAMFGSIMGLQCGSFEGQTNYLKKKGLVPAIGGWIIRSELDKNGLFKNFSPKFYVFPDIKDDWKNYNHTIPEQQITEPIFDD
jgi:UDP-2,3-diacylglucosamine pyrophosphatase LpxH